MFTDVTEKTFTKDAFNAINFVTNAGILSGYCDGSFRPENRMTNAEVCKALYQTFYNVCYETSEKLELKQHTPHWAHDFLEFVYDFASIDPVNFKVNAEKIIENPDNPASVTQSFEILEDFFSALIPDCTSYPYPPDDDRKYIPQESKDNKITRLTFAKAIYWFVTQFVQTITFHPSKKNTPDSLFLYWAKSPINPFSFALNIQQYDHFLFNNISDIRFFNLFKYINDSSIKKSQGWYLKIVNLDKKIRSAFKPTSKHKSYQYTSLSALYSMLTKSNMANGNNPPEIQLHLSNTAYLNDPDEGYLFKDKLEQTLESKNLKQKYEQLTTHQSNPSSCNLPQIETSDTYIVSFSQVDKERLPMWVQYANDAQGCRIEFDTSYLKCDSIEYRDPSDPLPQIMNTLITMAATPSYSRIQDYIFLKLHEVQYYYKSTDYSHEEEVRYAISTPLPNASTEDSIRDGEFFPRLYCNVPVPLRIKSVTLGPKCPNPERVALYLKKMHVPVVYHSNIHYR